MTENIGPFCFDQIEFLFIKDIKISIRKSIIFVAVMMNFHD